MAKQNNGRGTKVGNFLRSIGKSNILKVAASIAGKATGIPFLNVVNNLVQSDKDISKEDKEQAKAIYELDLKDYQQEREEITKRWQSDNQADSWLSKNIRPLSLITSWVLVLILIIGALFGKSLKIEYITLIGTTHTLINAAYFGGREITKNVRKWRDTK